MPITTCAAPTIWPMRMTVASVNDAVGGTCSTSNAWRRSSRVMALTPNAFKSSASSTADASPIQMMRPSCVTFSNGITRTRPGAASARWASTRSPRRARPAGRWRDSRAAALHEMLSADSGDDGVRRQRNLQGAQMLAGGATGDDGGHRRQIEERKQPGVHRRIKAAQRMHRRDRAPTQKMESCRLMRAVPFLHPDGGVRCLESNRSRGGGRCEAAAGSAATPAPRSTSIAERRTSFRPSTPPCIHRRAP